MSMLNYYEATAHSSAVTVPLDSDIAVDVAVVGAGLTGCSAALELAEHGYRVALLEAERIGFGASGRNGGQALTGFAADQVKVRRLMGESAAKRLWDMSVEAVKLLRARIDRYAIPCDLRRGHLHVAVKPRQVRALEAGAEELVQLGVNDNRLLKGDELRARLASARYLAALYDPAACHIHPLNYTLGLAQAAIQAGAAIYTGTRVTRIEPSDPARLHTARGRVTARYLLLCGNAYLGDLAKPIAGYVMPTGTYIIATEPRDDVPALISNDEAVSDLNFVLDYFRRSADNRLLFGGRVSYSALPPANLVASLLARARRVFPQLDGARVDYAWGGNVAITRNRLPHFGRLGRNTLFAHGFSGHGLALSGLAGKVMAEAIAGQAERFDVFSRIPHARFPGGRLFRMPTLVLAMAWFRLRDML